MVKEVVFVLRDDNGRILSAYTERSLAVLAAHDNSIEKYEITGVEVHDSYCSGRDR